MIILAHVRPMVGDEPVAVEPCRVRIFTRPSNRPHWMETKVLHVGGPTQWTFVSGLRPWTGAGVFGLDGELLYRISQDQEVHPGETLTINGMTEPKPL